MSNRIKSLPSFSPDDIEKASALDSVFLGKLSAFSSISVLRIQSSNFRYLGFRELGIMMVIAMPIVASILGNTILDVFQWSSKEKVLGVHASGGVAPMADLHFLWNGTENGFKHTSVATDGVVSSITDQSISVSMFAFSSPHPAPVFSGAFHSSPKSFPKCKAQFCSSGQPTFMCSVFFIHAMQYNSLNQPPSTS